MSVFDVECQICGAKIQNIQKHQQFHNYLVELAESLAVLANMLDKQQKI